MSSRKTTKKKTRNRKTPDFPLFVAGYEVDKKRWNDKLCPRCYRPTEQKGGLCLDCSWR